MITRIVVEHYKSIERLDLTLDQLCVFVGPNASGKSNVVDCLRFIKDAVNFSIDRAVSDRHGIDSIRQWAPFRPYNVNIDLHVADKSGEGRFSLTLGSVKGNYRILKEEGAWKDHNPSNDSGPQNGESQQVQRFSQYVRDKNQKVIITYGQVGQSTHTTEFSAEDKDELLITFFRSSIRLVRLDAFSKLRRMLNNFEAYSIFPNTLRAPQTPSNETRLTSNGDNLTSVFKMMQKYKAGVHAKSEIINVLRLIMPNLDTVVIQTLGGLMVPMFRVVDNKVHNFNASQISDGTFRVLGILTALYQPFQYATIALEEPEQTVNPGILAALADSIKEVSRDTQILITTHSPELVDYFDADDIRAVEMINGVTHVGCINRNQKQAVKEKLFTLGELMNMEGLVRDLQ